jgi:predicted metalloprotease
MEWEGREESSNVEDRRSMGGKAVMLGGGGSILIVILALLFGFDPQALLQRMPQQAPQAEEGQAAANDDEKRFVGVVLKDTETVWKEQFRRLGKQYREPKLVLFSGQVQSACGFASAAVGPFYCPGDERVYLDMSFFREMQSKFRAGGDFAYAYVIAHEIGHHVQNLLGETSRVDSQRGRVSKAEQNRLSVRLELQADFLAGVWAHHIQKSKRILQPGDIEEAIRAANAIGDDKLQKQAQGYVVPDSFTHGTSEQRIRWFKRGFESGDMSQSDTFRLRYEDL